MKVTPKAANKLYRAVHGVRRLAARVDICDFKSIVYYGSQSDHWRIVV